MNRTATRRKHHRSRQRAVVQYHEQEHWRKQAVSLVLAGCRGHAGERFLVHPGRFVLCSQNSVCATREEFEMCMGSGSFKYTPNTTQSTPQKTCANVKVYNLFKCCTLSGHACETFVEGGSLNIRRRQPTLKYILRCHENKPGVW